MQKMLQEIREEADRIYPNCGFLCSDRDGDISRSTEKSGINMCRNKPFSNPSELDKQHRNELDREPSIRDILRAPYKGMHSNRYGWDFWNWGK